MNLKLTSIILVLILLSCKNEVKSHHKVLEQSKDQFSKLFNQKLVGLSIVNKNERDIYKKYGLDFLTVCNCDSPSLYIDKNQVTVFNYCENDTLEAIKNTFTFKITETEITGNKIILTTNPYLKINVKQLNKDAELYQIKIEGDFPKEYVGNQLKTIFTTQPQKFIQYDCGDYDG